jgi:hypothetical protein
MTFVLQPILDSPTAVKWQIRMTAINQRHQLKVTFANWLWHVVVR